LQFNIKIVIGQASGDGFFLHHLTGIEIVARGGDDAAAAVDQGYLLAVAEAVFQRVKSVEGQLVGGEAGQVDGAGGGEHGVARINAGQVEFQTGIGQQVSRLKVGHIPVVVDSAHVQPTEIESVGRHAVHGPPGQAGDGGEGAAAGQGHPADSKMIGTEAAVIKINIPAGGVPA
jgi:hypothetical protein